MGIVGEVGLAVVGDAANRLMDRKHSSYVGVRGGLRTVRGSANEVGRLQETAPRVALVTRVLGDAGHRVGVQHLKEQGAESTHQH
jgi:hypothetical protein